MVSRRQEKVASVIKESVSDIICNRLSDPRIQGIVSVTFVDISPDLRNAEVFLSIMAKNESKRRLTLSGIQHAGKHIQSMVGHRMTSKYCPILNFCEDTKLHGTLETLRIIEDMSVEFKDRDKQDLEDNSLE